MANEVYANMMEVSCKSASGKTICATPDVCFTPPLTPATPPGVPIPYPNTGMASDTTDGSASVKISGKEVMLKDKSYFSKSTGDEAGSAPKKGLITSKNMGKVFFNMWSMDVKIEGENVVRHLDITTHNHASKPGNSPPMPHTDGMAPGPGGSEGESCPLSPKTGNPVNPILGAKILAGEEDIDFTLDGLLRLVWQRTYMSTTDEEGWFGRGWSSPLEVSLDAIQGAESRVVEALEYVGMFGRRVRFPTLGIGEEFFSSSERLKLTRTDEARYRLDSADGQSYWFGERDGGMGRLIGISDRNDNRLEIEGEAREDRSLRVLSSAGQVFELVFRASRLSEIAEVRSAGANAVRIVIVSYEFTGRSDLRCVFNRAGERVRRFEYNADRLMTHQVYAESLESWYEYVGTGKAAKVVRHWDNAGGAWRFDYRSQETLVVDQAGRETLYHFDDKKRWIGTTDALGRFTYYGLDLRGNLRAVVDAAEHVSETLFDERGNPIELKDASGSVTAIEWHPIFDLPLAVTDPLGQTTQYEYDDRGNLVLEVDPMGAETTYHVDSRGLVEELVNAHGGVIRMSYDSAGRITSHTDCSRRTTLITYDDEGRLAIVTNALGEQTRFDYDVAGRLIRQTLADGSFEVYEHDTAGRLTAVTNALGARTEYRYSPDGLVLERKNALGHSVLYQYDSARRLNVLVNENGATCRFAYDAVDRVIEDVRFDGVRTCYRYDKADFLVQAIEAADSSEAITTSFGTDAVGRIVRRTTAQEQSLYAYDLAGHIVAARVDPSEVSVQIKYDPCGRVIVEEVNTPVSAHTLKHSYDLLGNQIETVLPDQSTLASLYYGCGFVHQIRFNGTPVCDIERDALHREIARSQGALLMSRTYDPAERVRRQWSIGPADTARSQPVIIIDRRYSYDRAGRLVVATDSGKVLTYRYDLIDQLTHFNEERFLFDPAHNLLPTYVSDTEAVEVVGDGRVRVYGDKRYAYDAHGRVVEKRVGLDTVYQYVWNDSHQLVEARCLDQGGTRVSDYVYDPFGRRVSVQGPEGEKWFLWHADRLLREVDAVRDCTFIYEPESFVPLAQVVTSHLREDLAPATYYYHCDQIGLPREMTDEGGRLAWAGEYWGWGRLKASSSAADVSIATDHRPADALRLQGQQADEGSGLHYNRFRYYDPDIGRFVTPDPIGLLGGFNLYAYGPNPVDWFDPYGLAGNPSRATHITYQGMKNGKPYVGYASMPGCIEDGDDVLRYRYGGDFSGFTGGQRPTVIFIGYGQIAGKYIARGLEQRTYENLGGKVGKKNKTSNKQNPVGPNNKRRKKYLKAADEHLKCPCNATTQDCDD